MASQAPFDPVEFKSGLRAEWRSAADGWRRWHHVVEAKQGGQLHSAKLVELAEIGPSAAVLDVGGGYGEPSLTAARVVGPQGRVVCTDLSQEMLAFGRERAAEAGLDNVEFVECDAEELDFEDESFDAVLSRMTLMFLPDVVGTLRRLRSFLKQGRRLAATVWGPQPKVQFTAAVPVIFDELGLPPPPPGRPGIFTLSDRGRFSELVTEAGFRDVETGTVDVVFETETPERFTDFIRDVAPPITGLVANEAPAVQERVWNKVTEAYGELADADGRVRTHNEAVWVVGTK